MHQQRIKEMKEAIKSQKKEAKKKEESYIKTLLDSKEEKDKEHRAYKEAVEPDNQNLYKQNQMLEKTWQPINKAPTTSHSSFNNFNRPQKFLHKMMIPWKSRTICY